MSDEAVCRTAPATPGLLITGIKDIREIEYLLVQIGPETTVKS